MNILQKIKEWYKGNPLTPYYIFNGTDIEYISPICSNQFSDKDSDYAFSINFKSGNSYTFKLISSKDIVPPILMSLRELFINGIGHSYIALYESDFQNEDVRLIEGDD